MKIKLFLILFTYFNLVSGQTENTDPCNFDKRQFKARIGLSYQKNMFAEIGISFHRYRVIFPDTTDKYPHFGFNLNGFYLSNEFLIRTDKSIIGPKIGYELTGVSNSVFQALAIEITHYTDFSRNTLAVTPKVGIPLGVFDFFYGYNFLFNKDFSAYIGKHKFGLTMNLNRIYWKRHAEVFPYLMGKKPK